MKFIIAKRLRGRRLVLELAARPERRPLRTIAPPSAAALAALWGLRRLGRLSGVTAGEAADALPGDEIVADPMWQSTRAITIEAPPEQIWPWIAQMGYPSHRAGWYTPHWLDRLTFGIKQHSADHILPELQQLEVGDRVTDSDDWSTYFTVEAVEPPHTLVLHSTRHVIKPIQTIDFSWAFTIGELSPGRSRLLIRARATYTPRRALPFVELVIGPSDFLNVSAMLRGIKKRVEAAKRHGTPADRDGTALVVDLGEPRLGLPLTQQQEGTQDADLQAFPAVQGVQYTGGDGQGQPHVRGVYS